PLRRELEDEFGRGVADHQVEEAALLAGVRLAERGDQRIEPAEARDAVGEPSIEAGRQIGCPRSGRRASGQVAGRRGHRASVLHEATPASMAAWMPRRRQLEKNSSIRRLTSAAFSYADQWPAAGMRCTSRVPKDSRISPIKRFDGRNGESSRTPHRSRTRQPVSRRLSWARSPSSVPPPLTLRLSKRARRTHSAWMSTASSVTLAGSLSMLTSRL